MGESLAVMFGVRHGGRLAVPGDRPLALALVLVCAGCGTPMRSTRLSPAVSARHEALAVRVPSVHVSADVRTMEFTDESRVLVVLELHGLAATRLDLRRAEFVMTDHGGRDERRAAIASGVGEAPEWLHDGEHAPVLNLRPGESVLAWVAFGQFSRRLARELPERMRLELPGGPTLALSRPGELPVWDGETVTRSSGIGAWVQFSSDETSTNLLLGESRFAIDPVVVQFASGIGVRSPQFASERGQNTVCCTLAGALSFAYPLRVGQTLIAPFAGGEVSVLASNDEVSRRHWYGAVVGAELTTVRLVPRHGPFPVSYPESLLGAMNVRLGLVHWFGEDRSFPSFGATLSMSIAYGYY